MTMEIVAIAAGDPAVRAFLERHHGYLVARRGELVDAAERPATVARRAEEIIAVLRYDVGVDACEILTLHCDEQWSRIGTRLVDDVVNLARSQGCRRVWLCTTTDNVDALRFYQRRGFQLSDLRCGAVDEARRTVKRTIPAVGSYGIPLRDEIELCRDV
jgi:ribosomal protein S18 acetylase RimI-like enzyme